MSSPSPGRRRTGGCPTVIPQVRDSDARSPSSLLAAGPSITAAGQLARQRRIDAIPDQGDADRMGIIEHKSSPRPHAGASPGGCAGPHSRAGAGRICAGAATAYLV